MADTINEAIEEQAKADVQSSSVDGVAVTHMSVDDKIKAAQHVASATSTAKNHFGLRFVKLEAPGGG